MKVSVISLFFYVPSTDMNLGISPSEYFTETFFIQQTSSANTPQYYGRQRPTEKCRVFRCPTRWIDDIKIPENKWLSIEWVGNHCRRNMSSRNLFTQCLVPYRLDRSYVKLTRMHKLSFTVSGTGLAVGNFVKALCKVQHHALSHRVEN